MTDARVAKRYARALFSAALKENTTESVEGDLNLIAGVMRSSDQFKTFLANPQHSRDEKLEIFVRVFSDRTTALTMSLLRLLLKKRREDLFEFVRLEFERLRREHDRVVYAVVTSAMELTDDQKRRIVEKVASATERKVEAEFEIDPKLIGGVKVAYDNYVLEGTSRGHLDRMKNQVIYDLLKQA